MDRNQTKPSILQSNIKEACDHPITIKDFCGVCGRDLRERNGKLGQKKEEASAIVSMVHQMPELLVSGQLSKEYARKDREMLLKNRKLALLVDLDQTLVHTTNRKPSQSEVSADIVEFDLFGLRYFTKIRPHTASFLEKVSQSYELHIVTFGTKLYAHKITRMLDPDGKYFNNRILSRDELVSSMYKTKNIKSLFPLGDDLLLMIDDRPDVWEYSDALIRVKPYIYFGEIGDINAPACKNLRPGDPDSGMECSQLEVTCDKDDSLLDVQRILQEVHAHYYEQYDMVKKVNDVKRSLAELRGKVLQGDEIVFNGIIPMRENPKAHWVYKACLSFGAKVADAVTDTTTVLVAGNATTEKLERAEKMGIAVVSIEWLLACFYKWQRVDTKGFEFNNEQAPTKHQRKETSFASYLSEKVPTMKRETINEMTNEVDEALSQSDEEDDDLFSNYSSSHDDDEMAAAIERQINSS